VFMNLNMSIHKHRRIVINTVSYANPFCARNFFPFQKKGERSVREKDETGRAASYIYFYSFFIKINDEYEKILI